MLELEYLTDKSSQVKAVVVPIELWKQLFIEDNAFAQEISEAMEDYCLSIKRWMKPKKPLY
ncbi:MAG: hypothetical protein AB1797_06850 [bacterium]